MTKATVPPPKRTVRANLMTGLSQVPTFAPQNMAEQRPHMNLNFKVPPEFYHEFKATAAVNRIKMQDLLVEAFGAWKKSRNHE